MITIEHTSDRSVFVKLDDENFSINEHMYVIGVMKPRYPVPSLYHIDLDESEHGMVFANILLHGHQIWRD